MAWWQTVKAILGKLTDWLTAGRAMGWWNQRGGPKA